MLFGIWRCGIISIFGMLCSVFVTVCINAQEEGIFSKMSLYMIAVVVYIEDCSLAMVSGIVGSSSCGSGCIVSV